MPVTVKDANGDDVSVATNDEVITAIEALTTLLAGWPINDSLQTNSSGRVVSFQIQRPNDTTTYAANEVWAATTPAVGGSLIDDVAIDVDVGGMITNAMISSSGDVSPALAGEVWLFDAAVTAVADNAAFAVSDAEIQTYTGKIPFTLEDAGNNGAAHVSGLAIRFQPITGTKDLRALVRVKNAYIPVADEVLTVRLWVID